MLRARAGNTRATELVTPRWTWHPSLGVMSGPQALNLEQNFNCFPSSAFIIHHTDIDTLPGAPGNLQEGYISPPLPNAGPNTDVNVSLLVQRKRPGTLLGTFLERDHEELLFVSIRVPPQTPVLKLHQQLGNASGCLGLWQPFRLRALSSGHGFGQNALANTRYGPAREYSCLDSAVAFQPRNEIVGVS